MLGQLTARQDGDIDHGLVAPVAHRENVDLLLARAGK
jgi:hypothetical protein